jgi:hypothetical protein
MVVIQIANVPKQFIQIAIRVQAKLGDCVGFFAFLH